MFYYLYWDESDEADKSSIKLRRSVYDSKSSAENQAAHDLLCLRCRIYENGRPTLVSTGEEPLNMSDINVPCRDCAGTKLLPSRNVLYIEESEKELFSDHANLDHGNRVWSREDFEKSL